MHRAVHPLFLPVVALFPDFLALVDIDAALIAILKKIEVLSPELQFQIGFAKPEVPNDDDINGDRTRTEYLTAKYSG